MPKIKIEIDASSKEIVEVISGLLGVGQDIKSRKAYENYLFYNNPYGKASMKKRPKTTKKVVGKRKVNPKGKHARKGGWTQLEVKWLEDWISTKPVNKLTVSAFRKQFGYKRSFSSLSNKAATLRKK